MRKGNAKLNRGLLVTGIAVAALLAGSAAVAADKVVVIPLGGAKSYMVPDDTSACTPAKAGLLRFTGSQFEGCTGTDWLVLEMSANNVPTVFSAGRVWMDRNLGASRPATVIADIAAYGDLYQWGRLTDGHEKRDSLTTTTLSTTDVTVDGKFILSPSSPFDWRSPQNDSLWQGTIGINNPCPAGFRLPTSTEWKTERLSWATSNPAGAYGSPLKLVTAGGRSPIGVLYDVGSVGHYWSSTAGIQLVSSLQINSLKAGPYNGHRAYGFSVRCLKD